MLFVIGIGLNFGWGFFYYSKKTKNTEILDNPAVYYLIYFAFIVPWIIFIILFIMKYKESLVKIKIECIIYLVVSGIFAFGKGGYLIYGRGLTVGFSIIAFWFFFYYSILLLFIYKKNNG